MQLSFSLVTIVRSEQAETTSQWSKKTHFAKDSPMGHLLGSLNENCDPSSPRYFHLVTRIDSAVWLPASRERIYIVFVHQSVGVQVVNRMRKLFETAPVVSGQQQCRSVALD